MKCIYCNQKAIGKIGKKWCCSTNISKCPSIKKLLSEKKKGKPSWNAGLAGTGICKSSNKGKTAEQIYGDKVNVWKTNLSISNIGKHTGVCESEIAENERREKIREKINKRYESGWMPKAGRCKTIKYLSPIAGEVSLNGTWELAVAQYLDKKGYKWQRNKNRFLYFFENKNHFYTPDFYIESLNIYLEVKGYETNKDRAKWKDFKFKLKVLTKTEIMKIKRGEDIIIGE